MHNFVYPKNQYELWMTSWPQAQITWEKEINDNENFKTSGVATTGKVDVWKTWMESPLQLPWTSLANLA